MDDQQFDVVSRSLAAASSRRVVVASIGTLALGAVTGFGPCSVTARRRRRRRRRRSCNPSCPLCQSCDTRRGRCQPAGEGSPCGTCRVCQGGACGPAADGVECGECLVCGGGACATTAPDGATCRSTGQCGSGRCFPPPTCAPAGSGSCNILTGSPCCSGGCGFSIFPSTICSTSLAGNPCFTDSDCDAGLTCRVFLCG